MNLHRMPDERITEVLDTAERLADENHKFSATISTAHSNLVIVELLARLVEKDRPAPLKDTLVSNVLEIMDLAEKIIRTSAPLGEDGNHQARLFKFGQLSQEIRNELANREKEMRQ